MSRGSHSFKQSDLTRALKGTKAAGIEVARIKIAKDGNIEIDTINAPDVASDGRKQGNQWDEALK